MANITVSAPVHKFMQSSQKRDMQDLLTVPLPFAAFTHTLTQSEWRKAAKFTSTKSTAITGFARSTTGYVRVLNYDGTWQAVVGTGSPTSDIQFTSIAPPTDNRPSFYAVIPCSASGVLSGDLTRFTCQSNQLTSFDGTGLSAMTSLNIGNNKLTSFDGNGLSSLLDLFLSGNQLTSIDTTSLSALTYLSLTNNQLTSIDTTPLSALITLYIGGNQLTSFDATGLSSISSFSISGNQLTSFLVGDLQLEDNYGYYTALDLYNQQLDVAALDLIYADLPDGNSYGSYSNTINVSGNPGAGAGSGTDPTVATSKGWTVVGDAV